MIRRRSDGDFFRVARVDVEIIGDLCVFVDLDRIYIIVFEGEVVVLVYEICVECG